MQKDELSTELRASLVNLHMLKREAADLLRQASDLANRSADCSRAADVESENVDRLCRLLADDVEK